MYSCKLIIALYVVVGMVFQFSTTLPVDNPRNATRVEWNEPQKFCGEFLEDLIKEICKGELSEEEKDHPNKSLTTECCLLKCSASDLKQQYCKDKSPAASESYVYVPKRNETADVGVVSTEIFQTTPVPHSMNFFEAFLLHFAIPSQTIAVSLLPYRPATSDRNGDQQVVDRDRLVNRTVIPYLSRLPIVFYPVV